FNLHFLNYGTAPTTIKIKARCPENVTPAEIEDSFEKFIPRTPVHRIYDLKVDAPGQYSIEDIEVTYLKSSGDEEVLKVNPVKFVIYGKPVVEFEIEGNEDVQLGDKKAFYMNIKNSGSAPAHSINVDVAYPTSVNILSAPLTLPLLNPDEETTGILKLTPLFTGEHALKVKVKYSSFQMGPIAPMTMETEENTLNINVGMEKTEKNKKK
ncbi:MAG: hypothetical protein KAI64_02115, partial [Thermoplasmata archaeon]|nr:hypothetical protein [Thermoplasmata archaeon]